ncbi:hypothetical protein U5640_16720 [Streptomyces sp. SS7]|uniref:hypothetical protein n=1 Tax=Streptomyces sp. SS7 TaxID=3108485 RepID=UPI0030EB93A4
MALELGIEDSGAIPKVVLGGNTHHVRAKEDVPHEHALPDLYGLRRGSTLSEFLASVERELQLRAELHDLINRSTQMQCTEDDETWGLLIISTHAHLPGQPGTGVEYVDLITSDQVDDDGRARALALEVDLNARSFTDLERESFDHPHAWIEGSNSFKIVRYAKAVSA